MKNKIELLAPAGDLERLKWAIDYGADAVYIGGKEFSLRANALNFSIDDIKEAVIYAHNHNAKVYVTVNIVFHNEDLTGLKDYLLDLEKVGVDAIIFSDPIVLKTVQDNNIKLELHLSTQQSTLNYEAVNYWGNKGVTRVVLGREASRENIKLIRENSNVQLEVFLHGAMCTSYSGRCVMSNCLTMRDANRGGCSQVCRFNFDLLKEDTKIKSDVNFSMATKDLSLFTYLPDLIEMGISSLKIEGRMRSIYYIATVLSVYREAIDYYYENNSLPNFEKLRTILYRCANREVVPHFFDKKPTVNEQYYLGREEPSNQDFLGIVLEYDDVNKEIVIEQRNFFKVDDQITIFGPNKLHLELQVKYIKNINMEMVDAARHPREIIRIPSEIMVPKNSIIRKTFL